MDPITSINMEFVRELRREWSDAAVVQPVQRACRANRLRLAAQLRRTLGNHLIRAGIWLKTPAMPIPDNQRSG